MQQVKQVAISCMPGVARERLLHDDHDDEDDGDDHESIIDDNGIINELHVWVR